MNIRFLLVAHGLVLLGGCAWFRPSGMSIGDREPLESTAVELPSEAEPPANPDRRYRSN